MELSRYSNRLMDQGQLFETLSFFGYPIMFLFMILEGPAITILAAFMATLGFFDIRIVFALSVLGDVLGDVLLYSIGRYWGMGFIRHIGRHIGISSERVGIIRRYFALHGGKTILIVKSTTGLCWVTFVAAGIARMPFFKFIRYSFFGGLLWSGLLVFLGYSYGYAWSQLEERISWLGWLTTFLAISALVVVGFYRQKKLRRFLDRELQDTDKL